MRCNDVRLALIALVGLLMIPTMAFAQASISGAVKDASGAVVPGVTVEAASPVLIEKVRTAVTDASGQYRIENLRPGLYSVTFTLPGFATVVREGIELAGVFTATVDADLRLGGLEETIRVTGESPVVDLQNTTQQQVLSRQDLEALPTGRTAVAMALLLPGMERSGGRRDVGGVVPAGGATTQQVINVHGSSRTDQILTHDGLEVGAASRSGDQHPRHTNPAAVQEVSVDTGAIG